MLSPRTVMVGIHCDFRDLKDSVGLSQVRKYDN